MAEGRYLNMAEHGIVAPQGIANVARLVDSDRRSGVAASRARPGAGPTSARADQDPRREDRRAGRGDSQARKQSG